MAWNADRWPHPGHIWGGLGARDGCLLAPLRGTMSGHVLASTSATLSGVNSPIRSSSSVFPVMETLMPLSKASALMSFSSTSSSSSRTFTCPWVRRNSSTAFSGRGYTAPSFRMSGVRSESSSTSRRDRNGSPAVMTPLEESVPFLTSQNAGESISHPARESRARDLRFISSAAAVRGTMGPPEVSKRDSVLTVPPFHAPKATFSFPWHTWVVIRRITGIFCRRDRAMASR